MSVKGLPLAVRLDPLVPLPPPTTHHLPSHHQLEGVDKLFRPPPPSSPYVAAEAPKYMSKTPPILNKNTRPRGLTPIIITPSSSRAHTPVQLLPLPPSLVFPQPDTTTLGKSEVKKIKFEPKLEPVNLEPLLPTKREEKPRARAVVDDDEAERVEKMHVRRDQNDQFNHQLPTPQTTPLAQALDTIRDNDRYGCDCSFNRGRCGEPSFRYTSTRSGKTVSFAPLLLDNVRPISLDPEAHPQADPYSPERELASERDVVERGRRRERGPSRFRTHERHQHRPAPYDLKSRPGRALKSTQELPEKCTPRVYTGKLNLGDIAAAAALAMSEADQTNTTSGSANLPATHSVPSNSVSSSSAATTVTSTSSSSTSVTMRTRQQNMPTPTPTPPHQYNSTQQPSRQHQTDHRHPKDGDNNNSQSRPSRAIHDATDEMIQLFSSEFQSQMARERELMQEHLSRERQRLFAEIQREREVLEQARVELERDIEQMKRERKMLRGEVEKEIREENEALKARVGQLQAALDALQDGRA
ncbi:hypothetical protein D9756_006497 [Leucocoprinus leucothites]|uniref:Uncharacterized protein n=1 Tax=Leucocoprinus leucothites TaxID=201217 RepID=A0A8H5LH64_9AGAR|nr:hypothetical protein D9756_006497 [Leucoagaricus leucothites]